MTELRAAVRSFVAYSEPRSDAAELQLLDYVRSERSIRRRQPINTNDDVYRPTSADVGAGRGTLVAQHGENDPDSICRLRGHDVRDRQHTSPRAGAVDCASVRV